MHHISSLIKLSQLLVLIDLIGLMACIETQMKAEIIYRNSETPDLYFYVNQNQLPLDQRIDLVRDQHISDPLREDFRSRLDAHLVDAQLVDAQLVDAQLVDAQLGDHQLVDAQPVDAQLADAQVIDLQIDQAINCDLMEVCNGIDDDCDSRVDENLDTIGSWRSCSYSSDCDESGSRTRTVGRCIQGEMIQETETDMCSRNTDGEVLSTGAWGSCSYSSDCDESASRDRDVRKCSAGRSVTVTETGACSRHTDGNIITEGIWGSCIGFSNTCDSTGTQSTTNRVCRNGSTVNEDVSRACSRASRDGMMCGNGCCLSNQCFNPCPI